MGAWNCTPYGLWAAPASVLNAALYLTATSTFTEPGDEAGATPAPKASPPKVVPAPGAGNEPAKAKPKAVEASQIFASPFGLEKPAPAVETPAHALISPIAGASVPTTDQAGSDSPASNSAPEKTNADTGTSSNQAANDNTGSSNVPAANPAPPQEGKSNNNAAYLPIPGLNNQATTAVPAAAANAVANIVISSTNAQGSVVITTSQAPGVIVTSTNAQGSQVVTTVPVVSPEVLDKTPQPAPVVVNGHTLSTNSQSQYIIAGHTLSANTRLILGSGASTTPVLLQTAGIHAVLVIGSSTTTLNLPSLTATVTTTTPPAITIGTQTITPNAEGQYIVDGQTLTPGGEIVVGGTTAPGGTVAVGGTTVSLASSATQAVIGTSTEGLAPYIAGGLGSGPNGTGVVPFLGMAGSKLKCWDPRHVVGMVIAVAGILWVS